MNPHAPVCTCGSLRMNHSLTMFPLTWTACCARCGRPVLFCSLKQLPRTAAPKPRDPNFPPSEWGY